MKANITNIQKLIDENFNSNKSAFAEVINVERSQVSYILNNNGNGAGALFFGGLIKFCDDNNLDFRDFIFLPNRKNINDKKTKNY